MSVLEIALIAVVLVIGLYTTYTDTRFRTIGNACTCSLITAIWENVHEKLALSVVTGLHGLVFLSHTWTWGSCR
jgi:Flp pilus assembly protein protease CpaA